MVNRSCIFVTDKAAQETQISHFLDFWLEHDGIDHPMERSINKNLINAV